MAFCNKCGAQNDEGAKFCARCGASLTTTPTVNASEVYPNNVPVPGKGMAIASMVCGIVSFFCFGVILGILAVIFGGVAKSKGYTGGMATAGIVLGAVGLGIYVLTLIMCGSIVPFLEM